MKAKAKRPKWASRLSRRDWLHLQEGQHTKRPTLGNLKADEDGCTECYLILKKVSN